jgi:hypothetical protein
MNRMAKVINTMRGDKFKFIPDNEFYKTVNIGRKRWAQLLRNEKPANIDELTGITKYLGVTVNDLIKFESSQT